jgi:hypothetical protein
VEVEGDAEPDEGEDTETVFNKLNVQGTEEDESEEKLIGM